MLCSEHRFSRSFTWQAHKRAQASPDASPQQPGRAPARSAAILSVPEAGGPSGEGGQIGEGAALWGGKAWEGGEPLSACVSLNAYEKAIKHWWCCKGYI